MQVNQEKYYAESGKASALNISLVLTSSILTMLPFCYLYSLLIAFIPIVYLNFLFVIGLGLVVSFISRLFNRIFKIRNRKKSLIITITIAVFTIYFQWVFYFLILFSEEQSLLDSIISFMNLSLRPDIVIYNMIEINSIGLWEIFRVPLTGIVLWIIWLAEAVIIIFLAYQNYSRFETIPFSEKDNNWYKKEYIEDDFEHIAFKNKFVEEFQTNPSEAIIKLEKGHGLRHSKISIFKSSTEQKSIITIDNVVITQRGKGKKDTTQVLKHMYVDNMHLIKIKEKFRFKKASIFEF